MNPFFADRADRTDLPALTGARGVAAWLVVLYHIREGLSQVAHPALMAFLAKGYLAVDFFFMLSGFVLWLTYGERLQAEGWRGVPRFLGRRIARIWPLHVAILAAAVAFALAREAAGNANPDQYPWAELPLHVLLVQNWGFTNALTWNDPAWSISCEWAAYLLFPLLGLALAGRRPTWLVLLAIPALLGFLHLLFVAFEAQTLGERITELGLSRALVEFAVGALICILWQRWRDRRIASACFAAAGVFLWIAVSGTARETLALPFFFAALLLGLALTATHARNPLGFRPIVFAGEISYATYLVHFMGYIGFKLVFVADPAAVPLPLVALFLLLTFAVSVLLHRLVELPAQRTLRRLFEQPRERSPAPAL